jgi:hypothetical protein
MAYRVVPSGEAVNPSKPWFAERPVVGSSMAEKFK